MESRHAWRRVVTGLGSILPGGVGQVAPQCNSSLALAKLRKPNRLDSLDPLDEQVDRLGRPSADTAGGKVGQQRSCQAEMVRASVSRSWTPGNAHVSRSA